MSVFVTLWEHANFGGFPWSLDSGGYRYRGFKFGKAENDKFSSMRAWDAGNRGNVFAFEHRDFNGRFAALNVGGGYSSAWWSYFGSAFNDAVSSVLVVSRAKKDQEIEFTIKEQVTAIFTNLFNAYVVEIGDWLSEREDPPQVDSRGGPTVYPNFFPSHDKKNVFVRLEHQVRVTPDSFFGYQAYNSYDATVRFDLSFKSEGGKVRAEVGWYWVDVEAGQYSKLIADDLAKGFGPMCADLAASVESALRLSSYIKTVDAYLLPGRPPDMSTVGNFGVSDNDITLVIEHRQS